MRRVVMPLSVERNWDQDMLEFIKTYRDGTQLQPMDAWHIACSNGSRLPAKFHRVGHRLTDGLAAVEAREIAGRRDCQQGKRGTDRIIMAFSKKASQARKLSVG
jgi:hypothetical protein